MAGIGKWNIKSAQIDCRKLSAPTQTTAVTLLVRCTPQQQSQHRLSRVTIARSSRRARAGGGRRTGQRGARTSGEAWWTCASRVVYVCRLPLPPVLRLRSRSGSPPVSRFPRLPSRPSLSSPHAWRPPMASGDTAHRPASSESQQNIRHLFSHHSLSSAVNYTLVPVPHAVTVCLLSPAVRFLDCSAGYLRFSSSSS